MAAIRQSPWAWVPTLYFAQGLPYVAVMTVAVIMYKRLGVGNADIALYTGWLYLPWVIKPFWSPVVDIVKTKRFWTLAMEIVLAVAFASIAFLLPGPSFFKTTLAAFWLVGFASATHDIASDGFYMLALTQQRQSLFVGIRTTFYRIAMVAGQGGLVIVAGYIEKTTGDIPAAWATAMGMLSAFFVVIAIYHIIVLPRPAADRQRRGSFDSDFVKAFVTFFRKPDVGIALAFMLLYRLPEAQLVKLINPFLLDSPEAGGLGLTTSQVGLTYGTVGVICLMAGGIIGGIVAARGGLKPLDSSDGVGHVAYLSGVCLSQLRRLAGAAHGQYLCGSRTVRLRFRLDSLYPLSDIYYALGEYKTSHYAIATGFMALGMMLPGMGAGWLQEQIGYRWFFIWTMV